MIGRSVLVPVALLLLGLLCGLGVWAGFEGTVALVSTNAFCGSACHEMQQVAGEYEKSIHFRNAAGVRASCVDCHMPRPFVARVTHMIAASHDVVGHIGGIIDTPEKFEAHRLTMAKRVWAEMEGTDSMGCRDCHSYQAMDFHKQRPKAVDQMEKAAKQNETCIACHKGISHHLPDMTQGIQLAFQELSETARQEGARADQLWSITTKPMFIERPAGTAEGNGDARLLPLSQVTVQRRQGDWLQVRVEGWQQEGAERVFYARRGHRIFVAALGPDAVDKVEQLGTETDPDTDIVWHRAAVTLWTARDELIAGRDRLMTYGAELYGDACSTCHAAQSPDHQLANQWIGVLNSMKDRVTLDDDQYRFLQKYLQLNARDTGGRS